jgi:DegT/DnrJ/EryC1/StrS aminotransferase family
VRLRHQLPVYSPIPAAALVAAAASALYLHRDSRSGLADVLRRDFDADAVLLCGSGTQALQVAIECARGGQPDAVVALPAFSCFDVASAAVGARARVTLYDLDPFTLSPDLASLENALVRGASVVVVAPLYGIPVAWNSIEQMAGEHGAVVIEDAAQGHAARYRGAPLGSLGGISTVSFGRGKGWTGGAGGAVLFRRGSRPPAPLPEPSPIRGMKTMIGLSAQWALGRPALYGLPVATPGLDLGKTVFHEPTVPHGMAAAAAAATLASRAASRREGEQRRANASWLHERIASRVGLREIDPAERTDSVSGGLRFPVLAARGLAGFSDSAWAIRLGVAPSYPQELGLLAPLVPHLVDGGSSRSGAAQLVKQLVTFPTHSRMSSSDRTALAELMLAYGS